MLTGGTGACRAEVWGPDLDAADEALKAALAEYGADESVEQDFPAGQELCRGSAGDMRRGLIFLGLPVGLVLAALWLSGGFDGLMAWVQGVQRQAQEALAGAVRALRGGEPGAMAGLLGLCFTYGVLHAAGRGTARR